ncbi:ABC transporter ATP-binding protein [Myxococcota bacterium]|nr:ABC transporter ATP-binding protein [Myxococcota bacterium]
MGTPVIELRQVRRDYAVGEAVVHALRGVDLRIEQGEMVAIMGTSGSGKSTLMNTLGCLDRPSSGTYRLDGVEVQGLDDDARADLRNQKLGFVFQGFNLLPRTTALENVLLPMLYDRRGRFSDPHARALRALERVGLGERTHHVPSELSGGQQQRVAIARALVTDPALLLADEPTGNLDTHTTVEVMALFQELNAQGITIVIVTHEDEVAVYCKRAITLRDGLIERDVAVQGRRAAEDLGAWDRTGHRPQVDHLPEGRPPGEPS